MSSELQPGLCSEAAKALSPDSDVMHKALQLLESDLRDKSPMSFSFPEIVGALAKIAVTKDQRLELRSLASLRLCKTLKEQMTRIGERQRLTIIFFLAGGDIEDLPLKAKQALLQSLQAVLEATKSENPSMTKVMILKDFEKIVRQHYRELQDRLDEDCRVAEKALRITKLEEEISELSEIEREQISLRKRLAVLSEFTKEKKSLIEDIHHTIYFWMKMTFLMFILSGTALYFSFGRFQSTYRS